MYATLGDGQGWSGQRAGGVIVEDALWKGKKSSHGFPCCLLLLKSQGRANVLAETLDKMQG